MRTTILAPVLALALAALVTGCGGSSSDKDKANTIQSTPTQTTPTATTTTAPTTTAAPAGGDTTQAVPAPPPATPPSTGGTSSGGSSSGSGGVYPGQAPPSPNQSPGQRYRQYCASHPSACGD